MNWYYDRHGMMGNSGFAILGMVLMVIFFFALVWIIVRTVERGSHDHGHHEHSNHFKNGPTALEVLDMRLAKGEISPEEYITLKAHLQ